MFRLRDVYSTQVVIYNNLKGNCFRNSGRQSFFFLLYIIVYDF